MGQLWFSPETEKGLKIMHRGSILCYCRNQRSMCKILLLRYKSYGRSEMGNRRFFFFCPGTVVAQKNVIWGKSSLFCAQVTEQRKTTGKKTLFLDFKYIFEILPVMTNFAFLLLLSHTLFSYWPQLKRHFILKAELTGFPETRKTSSFSASNEHKISTPMQGEGSRNFSSLISLK